jgi:hypothetical protein
VAELSRASGQSVECFQEETPCPTRGPFLGTEESDGRAALPEPGVSSWDTYSCTQGLALGRRHPWLVVGATQRAFGRTGMSPCPWG